jgi:hypothetical protein
MLESTQSARGRFEMELGELEAMFLVRPPSLLLAEYLGALTAENVLDGGTADRISIAYNQVRYSCQNDDPLIYEAAAAINRLAEQVGAMSAGDRRHLVARIHNRLQSTTEPFPRHEPLQTKEPLDRLDHCTACLPVPEPRRFQRHRVPLELSAVTALVTFFGGYFFHYSVQNERAPWNPRRATELMGMVSAAETGEMYTATPDPPRGRSTVREAEKPPASGKVVSPQWLF